MCVAVGIVVMCMSPIGGAAGVGCAGSLLMGASPGLCPEVFVVGENSVCLNLETKLLLESFNISKQQT